MVLKLELTLDEVNNVLAILAEQPYKLAAPLIQKIRQQGEAQANQPMEPQPEYVGNVEGAE